MDAEGQGHTSFSEGIPPGEAQKLETRVMGMSKRPTGSARSIPERPFMALASTKAVESQAASISFGLHAGFLEGLEAGLGQHIAVAQIEVLGESVHPTPTTAILSLKLTVIRASFDSYP